jgi:hypothetical protein
VECMKLSLFWMEKNIFIARLRMELRLIRQMSVCASSYTKVNSWCSRQRNFTQYSIVPRVHRLIIWKVSLR